MWSLLITNNFVYLMKRCNKCVKKNVLLYLPACFVCICVIDTNRNLTSGLWKDRKTKRRSASVTEWGIVETDKWVKVVASRTCSGLPELCAGSHRGRIKWVMKHITFDLKKGREWGKKTDREWRKQTNSTGEAKEKKRNTVFQSVVNSTSLF